MRGLREISGQNEFLKQLKRQARENNTPIYGGFELTGRCNLDCRMCYVHVMDAAAARKKELSTAQWKKIFDEAYAQGLMFALLTGGECLLRPDFRELYLYLWNRGVRMTVNTNGVLINEEYVSFFKTYPPELLQISLYGSCENGYEQVTGHRKFAQVAAAIRNLQQAEISLRIAVTPSRYMKEDFIEILRYLKENELQYTINPALIAPRDGIVREDYDLTAEEYIQLMHQRMELYNKPIMQPEKIPAAGGKETSVERGLTCNAGRIRSFISWDGYMSPCMAIPELREEVLEQGYAKAWEKVNRAAREAENPIECKGCAYEKHCYYCPAVRKGGMSASHCRKEQCELTVQQFQAGLFEL